jgi:hypothetical protein
VLTFIAHFLFVLAAWTLVIKCIFPVAYALAEGVPIDTYVLWDLWWVVHIWLGWSLLHWRRYTYVAAVGISVAEIAIITTKFIAFLSAPQWTIWRTNWFINKVFVLSCFVLLLGYCLVNAKRLRAQGLWDRARPQNARRLRNAKTGNVRSR